MTSTHLWFRFWTLLLVCVLAVQLTACATLDEHPAVKVMSSDEAAIACQAADALTTVWALSHVGVREANPLMAGVIKNLGIPGFLLVKLAMALYMTKDNINPTVAAGINVATCGIAASNVAVGIGALPK